MIGLQSVLAFGFFAIPVLVMAWPIQGVIDQYSEIKWIALYVISSLVAIQFFLKPEAIRVPHLKRWGFLVLGLVVTYFLSAALNWPGSYEHQFLDWTCFLMLALAAGSCNPDMLKSRIVFFNSVATVILILYGVFQSFGIQLLPLTAAGALPASLMGNTSLLGEFLGISILIQLSQIGKPQGLRVLLFKWSLLVISGAFLLFIMARSSILALMGVGAVVALTSQLKPQLKKIVAAVAVLLFLGGAITIFTQSEEGFLSKITKAESTSLRLIRWQNTLQMILDQPMGVGPSNYEFDYVPYQAAVAVDTEATELTISQAPHNGYLELASENGVIALVFLLLLLSLVFRFRGLPKWVLMFIMIDAFFAFPLEVAFPFYSAAIFLGLAFRDYFEPMDFGVRPTTRMLLGVTAFSVVALTGIFAFSLQVRSQHPKDLDLNSAACNLAPSVWRSCIDKAALEFETQNDERSIRTLFSVLEKQEHHFVARRMIVPVLLEQRRLTEACEQVDLYSDAFGENRVFLKEEEKSCRRFGY